MNGSDLTSGSIVGSGACEGGRIMGGGDWCHNELTKAGGVC